LTYSVDIEGDTLDADHEKLDKAFRKIHDQDFEQEMDICMTPGDPNFGQGRIEKMEHGICRYGCGRTSSRCFLYSIPCHWDYDHMLQTQADILKAAKSIGIRITATLSC
jgi:hypothetical protein